jgi:hypothetical protein
MAITGQAQKLLWGSAGGRCAICHALLTEVEAEPDPAVVVGEECHIVSEKPDGPRYRPLDPSQINAYDNLILLCPSDHEIVDKQPRHYTEERLRERKREHERWVRDLPRPPRLHIRRDSSADAQLVYRTEGGRDLMAAAGGAYAAEVMTPEVANTAEADLVGGFVQNVQDWGELWDEIPMAERLKAELDLTSAIKELQNAGFVVYCGHRRDTLEGGGAPTTWDVAVLHIYRVDDPRIRADVGTDEAAITID